MNQAIKPRTIHRSGPGRRYYCGRHPFECHRDDDFTADRSRVTCAACVRAYEARPGKSAERARRSKA